MREVIIGLIQLENELGDKEHNLEKAVSLIGEAAKKGLASSVCRNCLSQDITWKP